MGSARPSKSSRVIDSSLVSKYCSKFGYHVRGVFELVFCSACQVYQIGPCEDVSMFAPTAKEGCREYGPILGYTKTVDGWMGFGSSVDKSVYSLCMVAERRLV